MHSLKQDLLAALAELPGLEARPSPVAGGTALTFRGKEFAHFHHDTELESWIGLQATQRGARRESRR